MSWPKPLGHKHVLEQLQRAVARNRLASTFLFVGPSGIGKRTVAVHLAAALLCERSPSSSLSPCGQCAACQQVAAGSHPDLEQISKPDDKNFIPIDLLIGDREHRRREGLCHNLALKPARGGRKIAILDDADTLNAEGANCLLKTLEEPPPHSLLILIATSEHRQLPTIRSRCQIVRFRPLPPELVADLLVSRGLCDQRTTAEMLAGRGQGSLETALAQSSEGIGDFRERLLDELSRSALDSVALAGELTTFVHQAGNDATARRNRLRLLVRLTANFYQQLMQAISRGESAERPASARTGSSEGNDLELAVNRALPFWCDRPTAAAACAERCVETELQLESNANLATLIECWLDDLRQTSALATI